MSISNTLYSSTHTWVDVEIGCASRGTLHSSGETDPIKNHIIHNNYPHKCHQYKYGVLNQMTRDNVRVTSAHVGHGVGGQTRRVSSISTRPVSGSVSDLRIFVITSLSDSLIPSSRMFRQACRQHAVYMATQPRIGNVFSSADLTV